MDQRSPNHPLRKMDQRSLKTRAYPCPTRMARTADEEIAPTSLFSDFEGLPIARLARMLARDCGDVAATAK